jgi:hypothetical protein
MQETVILLMYHSRIPSNGSGGVLVGVRNCFVVRTMHTLLACLSRGHWICISAWDGLDGRLHYVLCSGIPPSTSLRCTALASHQ